MGRCREPNNGHVYDADVYTVSVINTATNSLAATVPVGDFAVGVVVSPSGKYVYVTNRDDNTVSVIDTSTNAVTATIPVTGGPYGVAISTNGSHLYVTDYYSDTVTVIATGNTVTTTKTTTKTLPAVSTSPKPVNKAEVNWSSTAVNAIKYALSTWDHFLKNYDDWGAAFHATPEIGKLIKDKAIPAF